MEENARKTFKLYALPTTPETIEKAAAERFSRATARYVLIYTHEQAPSNSTEIGIEEITRLTKEDSDWLADCNFLILSDEMKRNEREIAGEIEKKLNDLETALKAEKEKMREG